MVWVPIDDPSRVRNPMVAEALGIAIPPAEGSRVEQTQKNFDDFYFCPANEYICQAQLYWAE
jgi:hypothetical protein